VKIGQSYNLAAIVEEIFIKGGFTDPEIKESFLVYLQSKLPPLQVDPTTIFTKDPSTVKSFYPTAKPQIYMPQVFFRPFFCLPYI
jgi:hypothetical protein